MNALGVKQLLCAVVLCLSLAAPAARAATSPPPEDVLTVAQGQTLLLEYQGIDRVSVGDGELLEVKIFREANEILLIALKPGVTDLRLWSRGDQPTRYIVQVQGDAEYVSPEDVKRLLNGVDSIEVSTIGKSVVVQGKAKTESELNKIQALSARFPSVQSYVEPPAFERKTTVLLRARLLEVRRSALKDLGISWDKFINGPVVGAVSDWFTNPLFRLTQAPAGAAAAANLPLKAGTQGFGGISTSLSSTINLLVENGDARVLAEPTLACVSGGSADFLVGGEVPIPVRGDDGEITVEFKEFGIILDFSPIADEERYIRTDVRVEVSSVDPGIEVLGIPGFATRKTNTTMNVAEGQPMVIAGLVSNEDAKNVEKLPGLGNIPILGELFKSRQFQNRQTELVILIVPEIIDEASPQNQQYQQKFQQLAEKGEKRVKFSILD